MSESKNLRDEPWAKHIPDYMLEAISQISEARDDIRNAVKLINEQTANIKKRERMLDEREQSFVNAANDLKEFANRIYGPDSELTKITSKLFSIEAASTRREARNVARYEELTATVSNLRQWTLEQFLERDKRMDGFDLRLKDLEKKSA